jgi:hypothetical protein
MTVEQTTQRDENKQEKKPISLSQRTALRKKALGMELDDADQSTLADLDEDAVDLFVQFVRDNLELMSAISYEHQDSERYAPSSKLGRLGLESEMDTVELMNAGGEDNSLRGMGRSASQAGVAVARIDYNGSLGGGSPRNPIRVGGITHK